MSICSETKTISVTPRKGHGVTVGKFMPFHKGHQLMIDVGASYCYSMTVIVSGREDDVIPLSVRYEWLKKHYRKNKIIRIKKHIDNIPMGEVDEDGTVINDDFWVEWTKVFRKMCPKATHFVSSDMYGQKAAEELGIEWLPVDPKRENYNISGTAIRQNVIKHFNMICDVAKPYFKKKVAVVGPESTGKSTVVEHLKERGIKTVTEYGRTLSSIKPNLDVDDFMIINKVQMSMIKNACETDCPIVVSDTESFTTYLFAFYYLGIDHDEIFRNAKKESFDLYILLSPDVEWVNDGTRVVGDQEKRIWFFEEMRKFLDYKGAKYVVIDGNDYTKREEKVLEEIEKLFQLK